MSAPTVSADTAAAAALLAAGFAAHHLDRPAGRRTRQGRTRRGARWATRRDLRALTVAAAQPGRLTLGVVRRRLLAAEAGHSLLVVGPTQSGKTVGLAVPALLEWDGPVLAASVKTDLLDATSDWRHRRGQVWRYDPAGATGGSGDCWSPLAASATWTGARRMAAALCDVAKTGGGSLADGDFWYATAAKLLAPLLLAAARSGRTMADVVSWVDRQEVDEVADLLDRLGDLDARQAAAATWARDDRQRSAVYTTAETVIEAFADPAVAASAAPGPGSIDPDLLLAGSHTLYLCAPAHDQRRLRPLFTTLATQVLEAAYARAVRTGRPLDPPLLVVLDEAANVAPIVELDTVASTAAGHGIQLVTVWQDFAQLHARYATRAQTVINNHRVKLFLPGIADPATLDQLSQLVGDAERRAETRSVDGDGRASVAETPMVGRLLPGDAVRRLAPGTAVVVSGSLPPVTVRLRPWMADAELTRRVGRRGGVSAARPAPPAATAAPARTAWPGRAARRPRGAGR